MAGAAATFAACLMMAAQTYSVPPKVLLAIMHVEGGRVGQEVKNTNGTADMGPMQINTLWLPELAKHWKIDQKTARRWVRDNGCINVNVAAWILRKKIYEADGNLSGGIARYHSATPHLGSKYLKKVATALKRLNTVQTPKAAASSRP